MESQIHKLETSYLNETSSYGGNIIVGFEHYLKNTGPGKKRHDIVEGDRMFSNSSITYMKARRTTPLFVA
jgi:chromatin modification-related protein EAF6